VSVPGLSDAEAWELLSTDPLAYIRELAYAHAEKLREGADVAVVEALCPVFDLDDYRKEQS
jgi:hypothetical protein